MNIYSEPRNWRGGVTRLIVLPLVNTYFDKDGVFYDC